MPYGENAAEEIFILQSSGNYNNENEIASGIRYDNSTSHLDANNVQSAIDEIVTEKIPYELNDLSDVNVDGNVTDGQILVYNQGIWVNDDSSTANIIANSFSSEQSYVTGNYVIYGEKLYKARNNVPAGTEWDSSNWEEVQVMDEIGSGGGSSTLSGLTDVTITSASDDQVLTYNNGVWVNSAAKLDKNNPSGTGSFSLNMSSGATLGNNAFVAGVGGTASGASSFSLGSGGCQATGQGAFAQGTGTEASGTNSHAEGGGTHATSIYAHAEGTGTWANGNQSHAEGEGSIANGQGSHAEGCATIASSDYQHIFGKYNIEDVDDTYVEIIGNGSIDETANPAIITRSNARTLDWSGNETIAGDLTFNGSTSLTSSLNNTAKIGTPVSTSVTGTIGQTFNQVFNNVINNLVTEVIQNSLNSNFIPDIVPCECSYNYKYYPQSAVTYYVGKGTISITEKDSNYPKNMIITLENVRGNNFVSSTSNQIFIVNVYITSIDTTTTPITVNLNIKTTIPKEVLNELNDVQIGFIYSLHGGDTLLYDDTLDVWENVPNELDNLTNINISSPSNNQVLAYDSATNKWKNSAISSSTISVNQILSTGTNIASITINGVTTQLYAPTSGGSATSLNDLTDVTTSTPTNGQVLFYNGTNWVNATESSNNISYDNTTSQMAATNVKAAIDELYNTLGDVESLLQSI